MSIHVTVRIACALLAGATFAHATEALRLDEVLDEARRGNPQIRVARERATAMGAVPGRVASLDDPTLGYELWNAPDSFRADQADNNIFRLSQKLPFPGKRALAGKVAEGDAEVARRDVDAVELDVVAAVKRAYYDLWGAEELLGVYARERALVERLAGVAAQKYGVGQVSQSDVIRAQVEETRVVSRVETQRLRRDAARVELNVLLSRDPDQALGMPEEPPPPRLDQSPDSLVGLALASRPELAAQAATIAREETGIRLARRSGYPDFEVGVARFVNPGRRDGFGALANVTLPLSRTKYDAAVDEASARLAGAEAERRRIEDRIRGDVKEAFLRARAALLQRHFFVTAHIPRAEQSLRVAESGYQTGAVDFLTLMDTARTIESVHVEHVEAEAEFQRAVADLERAVGRELPAAQAGGSHEMQ